MNELSTTTHGRILSGAIALALLGGGSAVLMQSSASLPLMAVSVFVGITLSITALAISVGEHKGPLFTMMALILLPVALFLYAIGVGLAMTRGALWAGYGFLAIGAIFAVLAMMGKREPARVPVKATAH